jgi:hypothetical protein
MPTRINEWAQKDFLPSSGVFRFTERRMNLRSPRNPSSAPLVAQALPPARFPAPSMTIRDFFCVCVALAVAGLDSIVIPATSAQVAPSQNTTSLEVIARNGADQEKHLFSQDGVVPMLVVRPNQTVPVTLQFPTAKAGTPVAFTPLDGGQIGGGNGVVLPTGRSLFTFNPGALPGRYRVMVYMAADQYLLEFYAVDPNHSPWQHRPGSGH